MSHSKSTSSSLFEQVFEDRLAKVEASLIPWARRAYCREDGLTHDRALQEVRIVLWRRFREDPEYWSAQPTRMWVAYAKATFRWKITGFHRDSERKLGKVASDMDCIAEGRDIVEDEALTMAQLGGKSQPNRFAYPREILLAELRIDLQAAVERGMNRLCATQRRDMPLLISDMLEGYTLDEITARHDWTRNRGVTLMRKLRTVFYEEMTGEKKVGYLGSHHPLTDAEKRRIRELYATGLSYKKVAARVGRSPSAVEGVCKRYPPELVAQVRELRKQGLSFAAIARRVGRGKSYIAWLATSELNEGVGWPRGRDGDGYAPVPVVQ
jgi:transposase-like protein